ncbi:zinc metalloprotease [Chryseolinea sp. H1M3-3]|uniref:zinc metalloprotease n=1 Tax=Chryseolinea sp. H1M3-3 TaxID=3034144 RepID=UPI0023EC7292|nr:zinc metalloprotease [Chryseolinea sp. H1M3-3]
MKLRFITVLFILTSNATFSQRGCASMNLYNKALETDPNFRFNRNLMMREREAINLNSRVVLETTINVVVHVLWKENAQKVSRETVLSQIEVLNQDFNASNSDVKNVPATFKAFVGNPRVKFKLTDKDPAGKPHSGVISKQTELDVFLEDHDMKFSAKGGDDAWPRDRFLNIWVCNLGPDENGDQLLGHAQFPGGPESTDGVVIWFNAFGANGRAPAPFDRGRTATHEVGHWFNLFHIWGNDGLPSCTDTDEVEDTPNQERQNVGRQTTFPHISCDNQPNGDMFMNYMDYVDDAAMFMFSKGQADRIKSTIATLRRAGSIKYTQTGINKIYFLEEIREY